MNISENSQYNLLSIFLVVILVNPLAAYLFEYYFIPNIGTYTKDIILLLLFYNTLCSRKLLQKRNNLIALLIIIWFAINYLIISLFDNLFYGLYYLRLYLIPLITFFVISSIFNSADNKIIHKFIRLNFIYNVVVIIIAFLTYYVIIAYPGIINIFWRESESIPTSIYIAGGLLRLGFPQSGPNSLGIYFAINIFLLLCFIVIPNDIFKTRNWLYVILIINSCGLALTFSRSSFILLIICLITTMIITFFHYHTICLSFLKYFSTTIVILALSVILINIITDGIVTQWIRLNITFDDPSLVGHKNTFIDVFDNYQKFIISGYPRGTVGPKAKMIRDMINIENSYMVLIYDFGVYLFIVFIMAYYFVISANMTSKLQIPFLIGVIINISFLPTIYDVEIITYAILIFVLIGRIKLLENYRSSYCQDYG
jgi:hypothetical protein